jgi:hypothetical protein
MSGYKEIEPRWKKGESGNPSGRPKGSKNRSTIAAYWLGVEQKAKNPITGVDEIMSQEDLLTLAQIKRAREGDTAAYKALLDSTYGAPTQQVEQVQTTYDFSNLNAEEVRELLKDAREQRESQGD